MGEAKNIQQEYNGPFFEDPEYDYLKR